ncbi:hypothetical protein NQ024_03005 [Corynebacterium sp. 35RC1]|nr:hypothetical protein [Corynebacterium sp. 35RC1]
MGTSTTTVLAPEKWRALAAEHDARAETFTAAHVARRKAGQRHPVFDFLFEYYPIRASHLHRWHPGVGNALGHDPDSDDPPVQAGWKWYSTADGITQVDLSAFCTAKQQTLGYIRELLANTEVNTAHFDCFGLHEWAMVFETPQPRHELPLRLGPEGTDAVVRREQLRCTHFDAFRFFTEPARPLNLTVLDRESQPHMEQRGCLHANMDLYKWATKLGPLVPGELLLDAFTLAWDARILDMEASPYDCRELGFGVVAIETPEGKAEYVHRQRELAARGSSVRARLVAVIDAARALTL